MSKGPLLGTIPDVELVHVGMEFPTLTGKKTITQKDLAGIIAAAQDPTLRAPIVKLGHLDPRFQPPKEEDGGPALGRIVNIRLSPDGLGVRGDLVGMPAWLAKIAPFAFPSRSIEGFSNYPAPSGTKYALALSGVSLLGERAPSIMTLEDLMALWQVDESGAPSLTPDDSVGITMSNGVITERKEPVVPEAIRASLNIEDVRRAWVEQRPRGSYWWIREMYSDFLVVSDDDNGDLYRVPWSEVDGEPSFGEPVRVKVEYVETEEPAKVAASDSGSSRLLSRFALGEDGTERTFVTDDAPVDAAEEASEPEPSGDEDESEKVAVVVDEPLPHEEASADDAEGGEEPGGEDSESEPVNDTDQESSMDPKQLRELLGLPESASDEEVRNAISELRASTTQAGEGGEEETPPEETTGEPKEDDEGKQVQTEEDVEDPPAEGEAQTPEKIAAGLNLPKGVQLVDAETLNQLREAAQRGQSAWERQQEEERERILAAAVEDGKFPVAQVDTYRKRWVEDADGTRDLIVNHLASGLVPMTERGHDVEPVEQEDTVAPYLLFPEKDQARS